MTILHLTKTLGHTWTLVDYIGDEPGNRLLGPLVLGTNRQPRQVYIHETHERTSKIQGDVEAILPGPTGSYIRFTSHNLAKPWPIDKKRAPVLFVKSTISTAMVGDSSSLADLTVCIQRSVVGRVRIAVHDPSESSDWEVLHRYPNLSEALSYVEEALQLVRVANGIYSLDHNVAGIVVDWCVQQFCVLRIVRPPSETV